MVEITRRAALGAMIPLLHPGLLFAQQPAKDDEKLSKQIAKLDVELVKTLTDLAKKYDKDQVPEAAHFFASCALGFGGKDESANSIKASCEASVYLGKLRGGEPLKETAPITGALGSISTAYRKLLDPLIARARKNELPEAARGVMLETGPKYELARGAHEYVMAVQRFNSLRKAMGLRAVLWDFQESRKLILAGWYTCETEDWEYKELKKDSPFYTDYVEDGRKAARGANRLSELPEGLRSYALVRQPLLNPNARTLRLGFWHRGSEIDYWGLYTIPQLPYRDDIPTPSQRFRGETLVKDWVDTEETVDIDGMKVPYVKYPFQGEKNVPVWFSNGKGYMETGWAMSEYETLERGGVPIMLRFFMEGTPGDVEASILDKSGRKHPYRVYVNGDKRVRLESWATVLLLPEKQLEGFAEYTVTVKCKLGATPIEKTWGFSTRAK